MVVAVAVVVVVVVVVDQGSLTYHGVQGDDRSVLISQPSDGHCGSRLEDGMDDGK